MNAGQDNTTTRLGELWLKVLRKPTVTGDTRFIESGGNSVLAADLAARINEEFRVNLAWHAVLDVLTFGTFDDLASAIAQALADPAGREPADVSPRITAAPVADADLLRHVNTLTDDEVDALLATYGVSDDPGGHTI
jgi:hypothetical protein